MGQQEVIDFLKKQKEPLSAGEIAFFMKENPSKISRIIRKLLDYKEIHAIEIDRQIAMDKYNCRKRMQLYFLPEKQQIIKK